MKRYIEKITGIIPNVGKEIQIILNGKNLILTGPNGSGKTSVIRELFKKVDLLIVKKKQADLPGLKIQYTNVNNNLVLNLKKGTSEFVNSTNYLIDLKRQIDEIELGLQIDIPNNIEFSSDYDDRRAIIKNFEATRTANISHADTAKGLATEEDTGFRETANQNIGNNLEQHLVNLKNRRSLAISEDKDTGLANKISDWFNLFETNLKTLMEDSSTSLDFNSDTLKFSIRQAGKSNYTFQTLSSGYTAIFDIYADLLMRTEYYKLTPDELTGIVFIDEIDAHLHISLQRLIFPFLLRSFPSVQFIITTHSPFVLISASDSVVYDVGKNIQIDEDISFFSYSSIAEGLFSTKPISISLESALFQISTILNSQSIDMIKLKQVVDHIEPSRQQLSPEAGVLYLRAVNTLLDGESKSV